MAQPATTSVSAQRNYRQTESDANHRHTPRGESQFTKSIAHGVKSHKRYNAAWTTCCARPRAPRRGISGSAASAYFVTPLLSRRPPDVASPRLLDCGCGTGDNLELLVAFGRAYGFDLTAVGLQLGHEAGRTRLARATVTAVPFPDNAFDVVDLVRRPLLPRDADERAAIAEMYRVRGPAATSLINVAAMESLRGDHSVLSHEVRRYSRASLRTPARPAPASASSGSPTPTPSCFRRWPSAARCSAGAACRAKSDAAQEISVPPAPVNWP